MKSPTAHFQKGFSLIEIMIVILVIGVLSTLALVGIGKLQASARDTQRQQMMTGVQTALERFYSENQSYPKGFPAPATAIVGGTTVCCAAANSTFFNSMMTALHQSGYLDITLFKDPSKGALFSTFPPGSDRFTQINGWTWVNGDPDSLCGFTSWYLNNDTFAVKYAYDSDGQKYKLCLTKESGGATILTSPN